MKGDIEIEAIFDKIWHLHDKLTQAIHFISTSYFHNSIHNLRNLEKKNVKFSFDASHQNRTSGFVFVEEFLPEEDEPSLIHEAKNLHAIRTALQNLEDQLQFFHMVQSQQQADRDLAIVHLEQSRPVLATRLAEHHGKKYQVIEEALAFVGDVGAHSISPENKYEHPESVNREKLMPSEKERPIFLFKFPFLKLDHVGGILANAVMIAVSMVVFLHLQKASQKELPQERGDGIYIINRNGRRNFWHNGSSHRGQFSKVDLFSGKG